MFLFDFNLVCISTMISVWSSISLFLDSNSSQYIHKYTLINIDPSSIYVWTYTISVQFQFYIIHIWLIFGDALFCIKGVLSLFLNWTISVLTYVEAYHKLLLNIINKEGIYFEIGQYLSSYFGWGSTDICHVEAFTIAALWNQQFDSLYRFLICVAHLSV